MITLVAITVCAGILAQIVAYKLRLPAIVPLLIFGALLGQFNILRPEQLGSGLQTIVQIGVAIILFEGGLSLKARNFKEAPRVIRNLVTVGVLITWALGTAAAYFLIPELHNSTGLQIALLFGALITVSGPTVIIPLLKVVKPKRTLSTILKWEAILIDPIGALLAVVIMTFIETSASRGFLMQEFLRSMSIGLAFGGGGALILNRLLKARNLFMGELRNLVVLSFVLIIYAFSDWVQHETGIVSVTVAGFVLGLLNPPGLREVESFKGQLTVLMVSVLFILLAADLDLSTIWNLGVNGLLLLLIILLVIRPVNVFVSSIGAMLDTKEKLFLSWIAPRGIIAAAVASLFADSLSRIPEYAAQASLLESLTFAVIIGTVFFQGASARIVGKWLRVIEPEPNGILFVGANAPARHLAESFVKHGVDVLLLDSNHHFVSLAKRENLSAQVANAISPETVEDMELSGFGKLLAMTPNEKVNILACQLWSHEFGRDGVYRVWLEEKEDEPPEEMGLSGEGHLVFPPSVTLEWMQRHLESSHKIQYRKVDSLDEYQKMMKEWREEKILPLAFIRDNKIIFFEEEIEPPRGMDWLFLKKTRSNRKKKEGPK